MKREGVTTYGDAQCSSRLEFIFNLYKRSKRDQFPYLKGTYIHTYETLHFDTLAVTVTGHTVINTFLIYTYVILGASYFIAPSPLHVLPPPLVRSAGCI